MTPTKDSNIPTQQTSDLSAYELLRLEKIRRNEARLEALGLGSSSFFGSSISGGAKNSDEVSSTKKKRRPSANNHKTDRRRQQQRPKTLPTRSSKRLKGQKAPEVDENAMNFCDDDNDDDGDANDAVDEEEENKDVPYVICYTHLPKDPDQLDDDEFQVYANLRSWRLHRKNELEVEPYKICQNRTLCELIRRVRNDCLWGASSSSANNNNNNNNDTTNERNEEDVANELVDCWGLGPSKVAAGGFGWEMMAVIGQDENMKLLEKSRESTKQNKK